jgi:hypothetical protein
LKVYSISIFWRANFCKDTKGHICNLGSFATSWSNAGLKLPRSIHNISDFAIQNFTSLAIEVGSKGIALEGQ